MTDTDTATAPTQTVMDELLEHFTRRDDESATDWFERVSEAASAVTTQAKEQAAREAAEAQAQLGDKVVAPAVKKVIAEIEKQTGLVCRGLTIRYTNTPKAGVSLKTSGLTLRKERTANS